MRTLIGTLALTVALAGGLAAQAYGNARDLVARTQQDLQAASAASHRHEERERYEHAERHLSDFDRSITKGKWDKGRLDTAIDDVKNVVDHNTLEPQFRDALSADLRDLRELRATRGAGY